MEYYTDVEFREDIFRVTAYRLRLQPMYLASWEINLEIAERANPDAVTDRNFTEFAAALFHDAVGNQSFCFRTLRGLKRRLNLALKRLRGSPKRWGRILWEGRWHRA